MQVNVRRSVLVALLMMVLASPAVAQEGGRRSLTVDDQFAIASVGAPKISPDGEWVAYTVARTDFEAEKRETRIWMVPLAGGEALPMTGVGGSGSSPSWSPDGRYLTFLAARNDGKTQVWGLDRRGGEAQQLTDVEQGVSGYVWSPDGTRLALTLRDPEEEPDEEWSSESPEPWVIDRLQFKRDNIGYLTGDRRTHLYVFDLTTEELRQVTSGAFDVRQPAWSSDGALLAFVANRTEEPDGNSNTDIWLVGADNTDQGATLIQLTHNVGPDGSPAWSPEGNWITYTTGIEPDLIWYATTHLAVVSVEGGEPRMPTTELDRNVGAPRFSADGGSVWFGLEDSGDRHLAKLDLASGEVSRPVSGSLSTRGWDLGPNGEIVALISEPDFPAELFVFEGDNRRRLTHVNDALLAEIQLGAVENVHFASADGTEIEGFVVKPPGFQEGFRYPTLLRIHGGPVSQYDNAFSFEAQLFAAHGYLVLRTNPRGSSGYGQEFSVRLWADWGNVDFEDVMAGVDHVIERGWADPDRLGVGGWSYGGILTDHVITNTDRFKAAITGASEVLYVANYGHDHYQLQWEKELGLPWVPEDRKKWEAISPFNRVDKITTPTLIMGGEKDWNVPIQNSEQLYQALRRLGVPTQLVVYPNQHHGLRVPAYQKDRHERYLEWYDRWVKGEGGATE